MGQEFLMTTFPSFEMTKERRAELLDTVLTETIGNLEEFREWFYGDDDDRDRMDVARELVEDIEDCCSRMYTREMAQMITYDPNGKGFWLNITGGCSYGDPPTEMFDVMSRANHFGSVWDKCEEYAKEDYKPLVY